LFCFVVSLPDHAQRLVAEGIMSPAFQLGTAALSVGRPGPDGNSSLGEYVAITAPRSPLA
jgi:hypothetical protein